MAKTLKIEEGSGMHISYEYFLHTAVRILYSFGIICALGLWIVIYFTEIEDQKFYVNFIYVANPAFSWAGYFLNSFDEDIGDAAYISCVFPTSDVFWSMVGSFCSCVL